jgi:hypothetical protein
MPYVDESYCPAELNLLIRTDRVPAVPARQGQCLALHVRAMARAAVRPSPRLSLPT